jgi:hypothetical protein
VPKSVLTPSDIPRISARAFSNQRHDSYPQRELKNTYTPGGLLVNYAALWVGVHFVNHSALNLGGHFVNRGPLGMGELFVNDLRLAAQLPRPLLFGRIRLRTPRFEL